MSVVKRSRDPQTLQYSDAGKALSGEAGRECEKFGDFLAHLPTHLPIEIKRLVFWYGHDIVVLHEG